MKSKTSKLSQQENLKLAYELKSIVEAWVDRTFNYIQLNVVETMAEKQSGGHLVEFVRGAEPSKEDFAEHLGVDVSEIQEGYEESSEYEQCREQKNQENYPMWNTLFEFRSEEREETIENAIEAGFGAIEGLDDFNQLLFVSGAGYSFYGAHWIPLYLSLPYTEKEQKKYAGVDYSMM